MHEIRNLAKAFSPGTPERVAAGVKLTDEMIEQMANLEDSRRFEIVRSLSDEASSMLLVSAHGCAEEAVNTQSSEPLMPGLALLILENLTADYRDSIIRLALLDDAARRTGIRLDDLWRHLERLATPEMAEVVNGYLRSENRSLLAMDYTTRVDDDGQFTYEPNW